MKVIGSFVFRNEGDGCLTCKWMNDDSSKPLVECASRTGNQTESSSFVGDYRTVYIDVDNKHYSRYLRITLAEGKEGIYDLYWSESEFFEEPSFLGFAMLSNGNLIGHYRS